MALDRKGEPQFARVVGSQYPHLQALAAQLQESIDLAERAPCEPQRLADNNPFGLLFNDDDPLPDAAAPEADDATCPWACPFWECAEPVTQIIDWRKAEHALTKHDASAGVTDTRRIKALGVTLRETGEVRKLATVPDNWRDDLDNLEKNFPKFAEVVDYLRATYAVAVHGDRVPQISPILLAGPPGVGKTHFAMRFAETFGSGFETVHMETAETSSQLIGSAEHWANCKSGAVFNALIEGDFANPVFFVDEIDKAMDGEREPLAPLYQLLQQETAKQFRDASFPWLPDIDASRIVWIFTCNDPDFLPLPIIDRMRRFDVPEPTPRQTRRILENIFERIIDDLPPSLASITLSIGARDLLSELTPRQADKTLREAIGLAVYAGRTRVLASDIPLQIGTPCQNSIGFVR